MLYYNALIFQPETGFMPGDFRIENGKFTKVIIKGKIDQYNTDAIRNEKYDQDNTDVISKEKSNQRNTLDGIDLKGALVIPGLIDLHTHGNSGADFSDGNLSGLISMAKYLLSNGITGFLPTSMTLPEHKLQKAFQSAYDFILESHPDCADILGIHMEGPFLSYKHRGAQNEEFLSLPDYKVFCRLQTDCGNLIRIVDVAPELEGAIHFIKELSSKPEITSDPSDHYTINETIIPKAPNKLSRCNSTGIPTKTNVIVSVAHTDANYDSAKKAFESGACHVTHLFNGMCSFHHRNPGVLGAACDQDNVTVELISDGIHVHPSAIRMAFKLFPHRVCLISDALRCCGMPDGEYELGGQTVYLQSCEARLCDGTLAGSVSNLFSCMKKAIEFGVPEVLAIEAATLIPAKRLGLENRIGQIKAGCDADFIICDKNLGILDVYKKGIKSTT